MANNEQSNIHDLEKLRHSAAHLLAAAVLELYPEAKPTIGPAIDNGFYYDFDFIDTKVSDDDLKKIENKMLETVKSWKGFEKNNVSKDEAIKEFENNEYKKELIEEFSAEDQDLTIYQSGDFRDLCRGGHIDDPSRELKHFKLLSIAGAYWRGDEKNKMLTRIYGTAFSTKEELDKHLEQLEEAKKRDHKILGVIHDLFTFSDLVGSGLPLWTPKGTLLRNLLDDFVWELRKEKGYQKVEIPHITKKDLYEVSGHWDKFADELFKIQTREKHMLAMKPMYCPHHFELSMPPETPSTTPRLRISLVTIRTISAWIAPAVASRSRWRTLASITTPSPGMTTLTRGRPGPRTAGLVDGRQCLQVEPRPSIATARPVAGLAELWYENASPWRPPGIQSEAAAPWCAS